MGKTIYQQNERRVARAFDSQSASFDKLFAQNTIVQYKRKRVRDRVLKLLRPGSRILELNSGTGDDAIFFAKHGYDVHATDISEGMQKKLAEKKRRKEKRKLKEEPWILFAVALILVLIVVAYLFLKKFPTL